MKRKSGFTIIEVVLVLAIAGLIFLMVFIALPALQRSQRDSQRGNDITRLQGALQKFQENNRGQIPDPAQGGVTSADAATMNPSDVGSARTWKSFYARYLLVGADGVNDAFEDPDGTPYGLDVSVCAGTCEQAAATWAEQVGDRAHAITVVVNAACDGEMIVPSTGARKVAMAYKLEGGGIRCVNN